MDSTQVHPIALLFHILSYPIAYPLLSILLDALATKFSSQTLVLKGKRDTKRNIAQNIVPVFVDARISEGKIHCRPNGTLQGLVWKLHEIMLKILHGNWHPCSPSNFPGPLDIL